MLLENRMPSATRAPAAPLAATSTASPLRNAAPAAPAPPRATDDEILGIVSPRKNPPRDTQQLEFDFDAADAADSADGLRTAGTFSDALAAQSAPLPSAQNDNSNTPVAHTANAQATTIPEPAHLRATFDANPELRSAWRDASAYRESFATPDAARQATALLADVNHMDALFFSRRPEDHASLARTIANLDPAAFASLAEAMQSIAAGSVAQASAERRLMEMTTVPQETTSAITPHLQPHSKPSENAPQAAFSHNESSTQPHATQAQAPTDRRPMEMMPVLPETANQAHAQSATANESQLAFLHAANAAAVEGVVAAIEGRSSACFPKASRKTRAPAWSAKSTANSIRASARIRNLVRSCATPSAPARSTTVTSAPSSRFSQDAPARRCQV